jgi:NADH-quinone oxidoreductase subunit M
LQFATEILGLLGQTSFLFYLFWESIPYVSDWMWGRKKDLRHYQVYPYTVVCALMLIALIDSISFTAARRAHTPFLSTGMHTSQPRNRTGSCAFLLAFAIKIPVIPVHSWLPDAHTEAPTAGSVILAGLLLKTGAYALLRFAFPLFPMASKLFVPLLLVLGLGGLFYASWIALAQKDIKRLVAYSSIGHMGLVVIGVAVWNVMTLSGAILQMVNHGLTTSALFILVGMLTNGSI